MRIFLFLGLLFSQVLFVVLDFPVFITTLFLLVVAHFFSGCPWSVRMVRSFWASYAVILLSWFSKVYFNLPYFDFVAAFSLFALLFLAIKDYVEKPQERYFSVEFVGFLLWLGVALLFLSLNETHIQYDFVGAGVSGRSLNLDRFWFAFQVCSGMMLGDVVPISSFVRGVCIFFGWCGVSYRYFVVAHLAQMVWNKQK